MIVNKTAKAICQRLICSVLIIGFAVYLVRCGWSELMLLQPAYYLDQVREGQQPLDTEKIKQARQQLLLAQQADPYNPNVAEYLALTQYYWALMVDFDAAFQHYLFSESVKEYKKALKLRPNSASLQVLLLHALHGKLSTSKYLHLTQGNAVAYSQADIDALEYSMQRIVQLAPFNRRVLSQTLAIVSLYHGVLSSDARKVLTLMKKNKVLADAS